MGAAQIRSHPSRCRTVTPTPCPAAGPIHSRGPRRSSWSAKNSPLALPKQIVIGRPGGHRVAKRGWIVILASIPTRNGRSAALSFARGARRSVGGLSVLNSSNRRPLRGGYWVVYKGPVLDAGGGLATRGQHPRSGLPHGLHPRADLVSMRRLKTRLRAEEGMTLIELLIAMVIMSIGIAALVAGFSSGIVSVNRARLTSTAGSLADQQMELYRQASFASLPHHAADARPRRPARTATPTGCRSTVRWTCAVGTYSRGPAAQLLRHARKPSGQARDDQRARRLGVGAAPLQRDHDFRLLDKLTTHST